MFFRSPAEDLEVTSPDNRFNMSLSQRLMHNSVKQQVDIAIIVPNVDLIHYSIHSTNEKLFSRWSVSKMLCLQLPL